MSNKQIEHGSKVISRGGVVNANQQNQKLSWVFGDDPHRLATIPVTQGLLDVNIQDRLALAGRALRIHTRVAHEDDKILDEHQNVAHFDDYLSRLINTQPLKSFSKLMCPHLLRYILYSTGPAAIINEEPFFSLLEELRTSYDTLPPSNQLVYRDTKRQSQPTTEVIRDASLIIQWSCMELAKCLVQNYLGTKLNVERFLSLVEERISHGHLKCDQASMKILSILLCNIDKILLGHMSESSDGKHNLQPDRIREVINCDKIIWDWLLEHRPTMAKFSLLVNEPAECLWTASMNIDLRNSHKDEYDLFIQSAKRLGDLDLLRGLSSMLRARGDSPELGPLMLMIKNLEGRFEDTCESAKSLNHKYNDQELKELFDAYRELGRIREFQDSLDQVSDPDNKWFLQGLSDSISLDASAKDQMYTAQNWLTRWSKLPVTSPTEVNYIRPSDDVLDYVIPTCLNMANRVECGGTRDKLLAEAELCVKQNFTAQCINVPNFINPRHQVYFPLITLLGSRDFEILRETIHAKVKDLKWNHRMYRSLLDMNIFDNLRQQHSSLDLIQLNTIKFNFRRNNMQYASSVAQDLVAKTKSREIHYKARLLSLKFLKPTNQRDEELASCAIELMGCDIKVSSRCDLVSKALRQIIRSPVVRNERELVLSNILDKSSGSIELKNLNPFLNWMEILSHCSINSKVKTLAAVSKCLYDRYQSKAEDHRLLNDLFKTNLNLLMNVCHSRKSDRKSVGLICATSILKHIQEDSSRLNESMIQNLTSVDFLASTKNIWFELRKNLLSTIIYKRDIGSSWRQALIHIVCSLSEEQPEAFIYDIVVNRLDLRSKLHLWLDKSETSAHDFTSALLLNKDIMCSKEQKSLQDCQTQLDFWDFLMDHITRSLDDWFKIFVETEKFIKEIRRVSYLCGEYLSTLASRIPKDLNSFRKYLKKNCDTDGKQKPECKARIGARLSSLCNTHYKAIETLLSYKKISGLTKYEKWFFDTFSLRLKSIATAFVSLKDQRSIMDSDIFDSCFDQIAWELRLCEMDILSYNHETRQQLFMELISPILSRMQPSLIPMPGELKGSPVTTIHKISQTIQLISSKNHPKKLKLIGSDGLARSFLLKAHDDLRLDQLLMDVFTSINTLLSSSKTAKNCRIKRYSVVPVSSRSGLIQWIDAPSLCSTYRSWALGPKGVDTIKRLYRKTCVDVCYNGNPIEPNAKHECETPEGSLIMHPFRRILQAKLKPATTSAARLKVDPKVRESCVRELMDWIPNQLISNELLYSSHNAHSFWIKTNRFISSWATMCVVGYVVGLGDRHLDNILLDKTTGEIIHIDFNICFELGKLLSVPERVPFRLTRNITHAFGFAGLEGGFTMNCRRILTILRDHKKLLLHLLNPVNLSFMVNDSSANSIVGPYAAGEAESANGSNEGQVTTTIPEMCSQESVDTGDAFVPKVDETVEFRERFDKAFRLDTHDTAKFDHKAKHTKCENRPSQGIEHNIKTPFRLTSKSSMDVFGRIEEKVSGLDGRLTPTRTKGDAPDLPQRIEDQVDSLIFEATSIENLSAMFEGWAPWL